MKGTNYQLMGVLAILFSIFILGAIVGTEPLTLAIFLLVGGLAFLAITTKDNFAVMGFTVLIFALLFYVTYPVQPIAAITIDNPQNYFSTLIVMGIVLVGLLFAFKATGK
ncbi:MAG: hypothetical protein JW727_01350 [Candidatus Aenigmarchaeota archaeon]|nr:hypothetical protein [Candidatus Aenigmarchaeota archaeon]